ncbi:hypothetical protein [Nocardioides sp. P86]|uniref:hypothetical protein n=1 Tax=Nocardioides sp. P86 TaxID=2939569 RepID=UPI00203A754D|nr:hypothetical protein [Nocardioides sp. P86]MCM3516522.1 hypothetical protein [Nocardioides sp. P86]
MRLLPAAAAAALVLGVAAPLALTAPASAVTVVVTDPTGDAGGVKRLDVTRVKVANDDRRVVVRTTFAADRSGVLVVSLDPRGDTGLRLVARKNGSGDVSAEVVEGAFTDREPTEAPLECDGLRLRWADDVARLSMPSTCLHDGDYGAVRFSVLTERAGGGDSDEAPQTAQGEIGSSVWIPRG